MHIAPDAFIDGEEVWVIVLFVGFKLVRDRIDAPMVDVNIGEEGVGVLKMMADASDVQLVGVLKKRLINALAADYKHALTILDNPQPQDLLNALASDGIFEHVIFVAAQYNVDALWQRAVGQRLVSFPAHNHGAARRQRLKILQVARKMAEQLIVPADAVALVNSHYHTKFHILNVNYYFFAPPTAGVFFNVNYRQLIRQFSSISFPNRQLVFFVLFVLFVVPIKKN